MLRPSPNCSLSALTTLVNRFTRCHTIIMRIGDFEIPGDVPEFKEPHVLAVLRPWIDVGNVGTLSLERLERHLQAKELGRLARPGRFYDFTRYRPRSYIEQGKRGYSIPSTVVRYAIRDNAPDLIFLHLLEPHCYGEDYTESVIELLKFVGARRYSLIGAMYDMVPHTRRLLVTGGSSQGQAEEEYRLVGARPSNYEGPTTITYLISQQAEALGMDTRTFVVHLPQYFQVDEDFTGTARLMEVLCSLYDLPDRLKESERGEQQYEALRDIVTGTSEVSSLLQRLEERYDRENNETPSSTTTELPPSIEEFLQGFNQDPDSPEQT
jgi:hypothetical protein